MTVQSIRKSAASKPRSTKVHRAGQREKVTKALAKPSLALRLRQQMNVSQPLFARLLPISVRSLAKLEGGTPPTDVVSRRLTELSRLTKALFEVIRQESVSIWLQTPNKAFDDLKPLEVIERGEGDRIWSMIFFLRSGVPS